MTGFWRRLFQSERGATAVEFALIAMPLFMLLFALTEFGLLFLLSATLDDAAQTSARKIRTGNFVGGSASGFKTDLCNNMVWLNTDCLSALSVDVRSYSSFSAVNPPSPFQNGQFNAGNMTFVPGNPKDIILVCVYYRWKMFTPFLQPAFSPTGDGNIYVSSTVVFRNEPWGL